MPDKNQMILYREMLLDLHYRFSLAEELFCHAAESLISASALEGWRGKREALFKINAYSNALQIIHADLYRILEEKRAVFPPDLQDWIWDQPDAEAKVSLHLERLHVVAEGLQTEVSKELLRLEVAK